MFVCTDWDIFHELDMRKSTQAATDYIHFCVDSVIPQITLKAYPNNKPYITEEVTDWVKRQARGKNL